MSLRESVMEIYARGFRDGERHALDLTAQIMRDVAATAVRWAVAAGGNTPLAIIAKTLREKADALTPAAAPAAEVKVNACQVDLRTDKDRECFDDIVQAATRVLRSEPAALLPRVLAVLEGEGARCGHAGDVLTAGVFRSLAAELRAYIAERAAKAKGEGR